MNTNLDKIALDLYGKIETRFSNIKMGDENAKVLSKKEDIPKARFFEFEYKENGVGLGTIAITLDEDDGVVIQISGDLANEKHHGAFKFIRSFRQFAKDRLLNFDVQNIGKSELDKRDYEFQAKRKEEPEMQQPMQQPVQQPKPKMAPKSSMMENKMYGTNRMSYQDLGDARLIVKHTQPVNPEIAAGRTMHIEGIWVETAEGERFKYPFKHLNGARALAEHLKAGGNPYDNIGKHISSLSEELAQLRKFKGYVGRNEALSEAMGDITSKVMERIEEIKKEVHSLQRPAYYAQFAESFTDREEQMIPEEIMSDWIDRLTIRTFNEELKTAFPYIYRLVGENIPTKELGPDDLLDETSDNLGTSGGNIHNGYRGDSVAAMEDEVGTPYYVKLTGNGPVVKSGNGFTPIVASKIWDTMTPEIEEKARTQGFRKITLSVNGAMIPALEGGGKVIVGKTSYGTIVNSQNEEHNDPEDQFESFVNSIFEDETEQAGEDTLFSPNKDTQQAAIAKFNEIMSTELKGGPEGINIIDSLKGVIDDPEFLEKMKDIDPDLDARAAIEAELISMSKDNEDVARILPQLSFKGGDQVGGETPPADAAAPTPGAGAPPAAPPADPNAPPPAAPPADPNAPPPAPPMAESSKAKLIKAIHTAKNHGAKLDTKLDFGHKEMTLHDCMRECGMSPQDFGFDQGESNESGVDQILKSIAGFWNKEAKNFTIGGTRAKITVIKDFKNGEFKNASEEDLKHVIQLIDRADPSEKNNELGHIKHLAGMHSQVTDEQMPGMDNPHDMMKNMMGKMQMPSMPQMPDMPQGGTNTSSHTVNGKSVDKATYDQFMTQHPELNKAHGMLPKPKVSWDANIRQQQTGGNRRNAMDNFEESTELTAMLKIAGLRK